jgi:hypothetical protein
LTVERLRVRTDVRLDSILKEVSVGPVRNGGTTNSDNGSFAIVEGSVPRRRCTTTPIIFDFDFDFNFFHHRWREAARVKIRSKRSCQYFFRELPEFVDICS